MQAEVKRGNLFTSRCQTLVNTVNCEGVMGAGIALEFRLRHQPMFKRYVELCRDGHIDIGKLWLYKPPQEAGDRRWVLNFPTKREWRKPSLRKYLEEGLWKFVDTYEAKGIESVAFPALGARNGGLDEDEVIDLMRQRLEACRIPVEIYRYDPEAGDDLFDRFRDQLMSLSDREAADATGVAVNRVRTIRQAMEAGGVRSLSRLASVRGIGPVTLEKCFRHVMAGRRADTAGEQLRLPATVIP